MSESKGICFVIMPISDPEGYDKGHFESVYRDIFTPAIEKAGYTPHRVDEDASSGLIQAKIIENLINAPMTICDLSSRNPNVLFELGVRQAYNKPVVLVQEIGTKRIFDINGISCLDYDPTLLYKSVRDSQEKIANAICETEKNPQYNSLITALSISEAKYQKQDVADGAVSTILLEGIMQKLDSLESKLERLYGLQNETICFWPDNVPKTEKDSKTGKNNYRLPNGAFTATALQQKARKIRQLSRQLEDDTLSLGEKIAIQNQIDQIRAELGK